MKKNVIFTLLVGLMLMSCATHKGVVVEKPVIPESQPQQLAPNKPELWLQDTYPGIDATDPITFYNEFEINISMKIPYVVTMMKDGITYKIDSSTVVNYTVPAMTPSVFVSAKREGGKLKEITVSFDEGGKFDFSFFALTDKSFTLNSNQKVVYEGKPYNVKASIKGKGDGLCHLLSNFYSLKEERTINESAGGRNAVGTKIIK